MSLCPPCIFSGNTHTRKYRMPNFIPTGLQPTISFESLYNRSHKDAQTSKSNLPFRVNPATTGYIKRANNPTATQTAVYLSDKKWNQQNTIYKETPTLQSSIILLHMFRHGWASSSYQQENEIYIWYDIYDIIYDMVRYTIWYDTWYDTIRCMMIYDMIYMWCDVKWCDAIYDIIWYMIYDTIYDILWYDI